MHGRLTTDSSQTNNDNPAAIIIEDMNKRDSPHAQPMEQREQKPNLFGLCRVAKEEYDSQPMASLTMAAIGGSIESWSGMRIWHHKTMHKKFKYRFSGIIILKVALLFYQQKNI